MRIGVISDTHIPERCQHIPEAVLNDFKHVDLIIHAGDIVDLDTINELKSACPKIIAVAGNMDSPAVAKKFALKEVFEVLGFKFGLMHGYGPAMNLLGLLKDAFRKDKPDIIIFGHSHEAMNKFMDGVLFFNPGSTADCLSGNASYGIIEIEEGPQGGSFKTDSKNNKIKAEIIKIN